MNMTTQEITTEPNTVDQRSTWLDEFFRRFDAFFQSGTPDKLFILPRPRTGKGVVLWISSQTLSLLPCSEARLDCASLKPVEHTLGTDNELCAARLVAALCVVHDRDTVRALLDRTASEEPDDDLPHLSRT